MIVSVHLILKENNKILLYLRQNTGYGDGLYSLIAGHVDGGETITQATIREAKEEAGIIIYPKNLNFSCVIHRNENDREIIDYFMHTSKWENPIQNLEPEKCKELKFFGADKLPRNIIPYIKHGMSCYFSNVSFSEFGWDAK